MKTKQIVVVIFTGIFVLCGVFPPWRSPGGFNSGYRMLLDPPNQSHVDLSRLLVEWVLVAVVGAVAWWLVKPDVWDCNDGPVPERFLAPGDKVDIYGNVK